MRKNIILNSLLTLFLMLCLVSPLHGRQRANYHVIPLPQDIKLVDERPFILNGNSNIIFPADNLKMAKNAQFLSEFIKEATGINVKINSKGKKNITLELDTTLCSPEAYKIVVSKNNVTIYGGSEAGVFYGIQTLRKSLPFGQYKVVDLPSAIINDFPRFEYRGMMLDVSRHFFPIEFVKRYIDILALHNVNHFHWHLSEDQGWRIEIKKYPKLTEFGSLRKETVIGHNSGEYDGMPYGGYYTQEEAKQIVAYAAERYITVIPEIDMPGHMRAALASYPELGCTGGPYEVWTKWGVSDDVLCVGNDNTLNFIKNVLTEILDIFPSEYIHIGGDECPKTRWKECPKCQEKIEKEGLIGDENHSREERLQSYFISYVEDFLNSKGRRIIGWDEILEGGLAPNATVMSWRGIDGGIEAAKQKHRVIMTPNGYLYFDHYQSREVEKEPMAIGGYTPVEKVYAFEPVPSTLSEKEKQYIIGTQANVWTEYICSGNQVEYMVLPRLAALAEVQWCMPQKKNYNEFLQRLTHQFEIYSGLGYNYAKHLAQ
jgi:hexosaminidase